MKTFSTVVIAAILSAVAMSASASGVSREQVIAELVRARASGELAEMNSENTGAFRRNMPSTRTRAQVVAELQASRTSGELARLQAEDPTLQPSQPRIAGSKLAIAQAR